jgi:hypothetical protein
MGAGRQVGDGPGANKQRSSGFDRNIGHHMRFPPIMARSGNGEVNDLTRPLLITRLDAGVRPISTEKRTFPEVAEGPFAASLWSEPVNVAGTEVKFFKHPLLLCREDCWYDFRRPAFGNSGQDQRQGLIMLGQGQPHLLFGLRCVDRGHLNDSERIAEGLSHHC